MFTSARKITVIGAPLDLGAGRRGVDMGPSAFRVANVDGVLRDLGYEVHDAGDVRVSIAETRSPGDPSRKYLDEIRETCETLRDAVQASVASGSFPVVLGGDHSVAMGTLAGLSRHFASRGERLGVIWFDAHADSNTPETSPTGNIHGMPLAVALGLGDERLTGLAGQVPMVSGRHAAAIGLRDVDVAERANVRASGLHAYTMRDLDERGMRAVVLEAIERASDGTAGIHVSFDLDAMDPDYAPGVGTPSPGGLSYREAHLAMELLADCGKVVSAEFVEVNPVLDHGNSTARLGVGLLASLVGKRIL
jgi:arginase